MQQTTTDSAAGSDCAVTTTYTVDMTSESRQNIARVELLGGKEL